MGSDRTEARVDSSAAGRKLGPYTILAPLGAGGMGEVYRARDERLGRDVALKVVRSGLLTSDAARARFRREALALARLNHHGIAAVYDVGIDDGADYIVMECVPGQTLRTLIQSGPLPSTRALGLALEIATALEEAHDLGVVHRDLKPGNVMVTPKGRAKILDFGLAKLLGPAGEQDVTQPFAETSGIVGTPLYMSPEQAEGRPVDQTTDLWSLGVILYEMLAGKAPFRGDSGLAVLRSVTEDAPEPLRRVRGDLPEDVERVVSRAIEKDPRARYQSASEMSGDISAALARLSSPVTAAPKPSAFRWRRRAIAACALIALLAIPAAWLLHRAERRRWAREVATPEIAHLLRTGRPLRALQLTKEAQEVLPTDAALAGIAQQQGAVVSISSKPPGAEVQVQDYLAPDDPWVHLGTTPLRARIPKAYLRWKVSKEGIGEALWASKSRAEMNFDLAAQASAPAGMSLVHAGQWADLIDFIGWMGPYDLPAFDIDRYEVRNRDYQQFVDAGGYTRREYWKNPFTLGGRVLSWDEAMALLRDRTGRPGPSTWQAGHYPVGQGDYPVAGVSWYEAAAYAAFRGEALPVVAQWFCASPPEVASETVQLSNISRSKVAPAGAFKGMGPYGTYDMVGNVREWAANEIGDGLRPLLGGAWRSLTYLAVEAESLPPMDRSPLNGFRCVRNLGAVPDSASGPIRIQPRDFSTFKPASDDVFRFYRALYAWDDTPLDAKIEKVVEDTPDWREEKVSYNAAYGSERVTAYLFTPKRVRSPFQTVVFFPSARVLFMNDSSELGDIGFFDYVVQSGRAVLYPIYKGTYERKERLVLPGRHHDTELLIEHYKDVARSVEYLRSRRDVDMSRLAYLGASMGAAEGVIYATLLQDAFRTVVLLDGGYFLGNPQPGTDQADFAPRLKKPVLMVNGRYDFSFSLQRSQEPLFRMLGTPAADKRHVVLESPHDVTARRPELVGAVLGWLDKYLGRVQ